MRKFSKKGDASVSGNSAPFAAAEGQSCASHVGASLAIKRGHAFVRLLFVGTIALLAVKLVVVDLLGLI